MLQTLFSLAVTATTALGTVLVVGLGAYYVVQDMGKPAAEQRLTVGTLVMLAAYLAMVYEPLKTISNPHSVGELAIRSSIMAFLRSMRARWRSSRSGD